jgi:hypothetical protein
LDVALYLTRTERRELRVVFVEELPRYPATVTETNAARERTNAIFERVRQETIVAGKSTAFRYLLRSARVGWLRRWLVTSERPILTF